MLRGHRDLKVFQLAYSLAMEIFHLTKRFLARSCTLSQIKFGDLLAVFPLTCRRI
jgi:hypothetical protein